MHWHDRLELLGEWQHDVYYLCKGQGIPKLAHIMAYATIYFKDKRKRDQDNFEFGLRKLLGDSLKGVVIFDDDPSYLTWGETIFAHDRKNPRTEITITECGIMPSAGETLPDFLSGAVANSPALY